MGSLQTKAEQADEGSPLGRHILERLILVWKLAHAWIFRFTMVVITVLGALALFIRSQAEANLLSVFLSYLPAWVTALPLLLTLAGGIVFACWRSAVASIVGAVIITLWLGGYSFTWAPSSHHTHPEASLTVMTYNRGQGSVKILTECAVANQPDIVVFQDAGRRLPQLAALPVFAQNRHGLQSGEFVLMSRWPIVQNEPLHLDWPEGRSKIWHAGTRTVIDWNGKRVVVYNIHTPTPRDTLYWYAQHGTFLYGILGVIPFTPLYNRHQDYLSYWAARVQLAAQIASRVRQEQYPVVLLGDLNCPPLGSSYSCIEGLLQDAHRTAGQGFGFTFPSNFKSIGRIFTPWIRIDHIFASSHWEIASCSVGSGPASQHLPVVSKLSLR